MIGLFNFEVFNLLQINSENLIPLEVDLHLHSKYDNEYLCKQMYVDEI